MMNSREIVRRTLDFSGPARVARSYGDSDLAWANCALQTRATDWQRVGGAAWERYDEWGNLWRRIDDTSKGEVAEGALKTLAEIDAYVFPDYTRPEDYDPVRQARRDQPDKWLIGGLPGFAFNIARKMRRLETYLIDLMSEREAIRRLHDRIDDEVLAPMIRNYAAAGADCVMIVEDWGTQTQTLVNPRVWHEEFAPRFKRLCALSHKLGMPVFMHSCGQIEAIVPGLMEAGVDLLQFDQPDLHGIDTLAAHQARGRITFWCPVDIQTTLQSRDEAAIRAKAREMLDKLWRGRGGFVAGYYTDNASIGLDPRWQQIACDEFDRYGAQLAARAAL